MGLHETKTRHIQYDGGRIYGLVPKYQIKESQRQSYKDVVDWKKNQVVPVL
jgi:hypothetical protein